MDLPIDLPIENGDIFQFVMLVSLPEGKCSKKMKPVGQFFCMLFLNMASGGLDFSQRCAPNEITWHQCKVNLPGTPWPSGWNGRTPGNLSFPRALGFIETKICGELWANRLIFPTSWRDSNRKPGDAQKYNTSFVGFHLNLVYFFFFPCQTRSSRVVGTQRSGKGFRKLGRWVTKIKSSEKRR